MPTFDLAHGRGTVTITVPQDTCIETLEAAPTSPVLLRQAFDRAWNQPFGLGPVESPAELFKPGERVVIVVNDHTRPTPTRPLLSLLWERIRGNVAAEDVTLLVATGVHRPSTEDEIETMLGDFRRMFRVRVHDCDHDLANMGVSSQGVPLLVNREVVEADRVIAIGHIGMHYYAGYSGGRKAILPGVAGRATIEANHARLTDPRSAACVYDGNPISEEMVQAAKRVGLDLIIDVVLAHDGTVAKIVIGEPEAAHAVGRAFWDEMYQVPFSHPYDVVIASAGGHPKDINLYQAYKAQYNAMRALRDHGFLFLMAACPDGIGHPVFREWIHRSASPDEVLAIYEGEGFVLGGHKAVYHARDLQRATICLHSGLDETTVRRFFMEPVRDAKPVLDAARARFGKDIRVLVMPHAADVFPIRSAP